MGFGPRLFALDSLADLGGCTRWIYRTRGAWVWMIFGVLVEKRCWAWNSAVGCFQGLKFLLAPMLCCVLTIIARQSQHIPHRPFILLHFILPCPHIARCVVVRPTSASLPQPRSLTDRRPHAATQVREFSSMVAIADVIVSLVSVFTCLAFRSDRLVDSMESMQLRRTGKTCSERIVISHVPREGQARMIIAITSSELPEYDV